MLKIIGKIYKVAMLAYTFITKPDNLRIVNSVLNIGEEVAKHTGTDLDNAALAKIATFVRNETKTLMPHEARIVAARVNKTDKGSLRTVNLSIDNKKGIKVGTPAGSVSYNHNDGSIRWGKEFTF